MDCCVKVLAEHASTSGKVPSVHESSAALGRVTIPVGLNGYHQRASEVAKAWLKHLMSYLQLSRAIMKGLGLMLHAFECIFVKCFPVTERLYVRLSKASSRTKLPQHA